jgi:hypothetical protein
MPDAVTVPVLALDLTTAVRLVRSAAVARAMAEATQLTWETYNDSKALNIIYTLLFWKAKPGWVEVNTGNQENILRRTDELTATYWTSVYLALAHGPAAVGHRLRALERARTLALDSIRDTFESARAINNDILAFTRLSIRDLARVKLASDVVIAVAATPAVGVSYGIAVSLIKEIDRADSAKIVLFAVGKEPAKEGVKQLAEKGSQLLTREANGYLVALKNAELDILRQNDLLRRRAATRQSAAKATGRLADATGRAGAARDALRFARAGQVSLKSLAWGFVAGDVLDAWRDYVEATAD